MHQPEEAHFTISDIDLPIFRQNQINSSSCFIAILEGQGRITRFHSEVQYRIFVYNILQ